MSQFKFGQNWKAYSEHIDDERIKVAEESMQKLSGRTSLKGNSFLDVGCGSGIHSLAALRLGADKVVALDLDPDSVATTQKVLKEHSANSNVKCEQKSVFNLTAETYGEFDIVYSWGVLHHTGQMYKAIEHASQACKKGGVFIIALYRKTPLCSLWWAEKLLYSKLPRFLQSVLAIPYSAFYLLGKALQGENPVSFIKNYKSKRGMSFWHDVIDWMGGYPYESISPEELHQYANYLGFEVVEEFTQQPGLGLFGSGCDEYRLRKK